MALVPVTKPAKETQVEHKYSKNTQKHSTKQAKQKQITVFFL
jgi:hypothetical protein